MREAYVTVVLPRRIAEAVYASAVEGATDPRNEFSLYDLLLADALAEALDITEGGDDE